MTATASTSPRRLRQAAAIILAVGLAGAAFVYAKASGSQADPAGGYQIVGGQAYAVEESPAQRAQTERMGGQALVMTSRLSRWFDSLWHGERLAWTLVALSALASLLCVYIAGLMAEDLGEDSGEGPAGR